MEMEPSNQKSLERVVSQRALQMGTSFPCQICALGFLCGVCLASLFMAALTSSGTFEFGGLSFASFSTGISTSDSNSKIIGKWDFQSSYSSFLFCYAVLLPQFTCILIYLI